ncbi:hypothetical protein HPB48_002910 [Haemaphysalis longicornis]|uniref:Uncharacterized protein n=1 Tax=Haemaphysalis longicornis TaxID=44386 RepID=A0A9J6FFC8_HAELO|nr:hypothetical protein HPB48_002910 [Haemaphysalis longicornis]
MRSTCKSHACGLSGAALPCRGYMLCANVFFFFCSSFKSRKVFSEYLQFCGLVLRNAQLYERSELENKRNQVLLDLARMVFEEQSTIEQVVYRIMTHMQSLLECERCQVLLVDHETKLGRLWKRRKTNASPRGRSDCLRLRFPKPKLTQEFYASCGRAHRCRGQPRKTSGTRTLWAQCGRDAGELLSV